MKQRIKINGIVIIIGVAGILIFFNQLIRHSAAPGEEIFEITGMGLILLGQLFRVSARGYKAENSRGGNQLIQDGPYSIVRNPMYLGIILIGLGTVLFILEFWTAVLFAALFILRYWTLFVKEEKTLQEYFGAQYAAYKRSVPRLIPNAPAVLKKEIRAYLPLKLNWFKRELLSIGLVLGICLAIEFHETVKLNGRSAVMPKALCLLAVGILYLFLIRYLIKSHGKKTE
jgi:protein-S-isoprenylcysteine O-methyltransferase Ste14